MGDTTKILLSMADCPVLVLGPVELLRVVHAGDDLALVHMEERGTKHGSVMLESIDALRDQWNGIPGVVRDHASVESGIHIRVSSGGISLDMEALDSDSWMD